MKSISEHIPTTALAPWRYNNLAIAIHWASALILLLVAALGWYMMSIEDEPGSGWYFSQHKSLGLLFAGLLLARLVWRLLNKPAAMPSSVARWQANIAAGTQVLLYLLMVLMPVSGYLGASYSKNGVQFFGLSSPSWAMPDHDVAERFFDIHSFLIWVLVALVTAHILGALKHLLMDKDGIFQRMWFKSSPNANQL